MAAIAGGIGRNGGHSLGPSVGEDKRNLASLQGGSPHGPAGIAFALTEGSSTHGADRGVDGQGARNHPRPVRPGRGRAQGSMATRSAPQDIPGPRAMARRSGAHPRWSWAAQANPTGPGEGKARATRISRHGLRGTRVAQTLSGVVTGWRADGQPYIQPGHEGFHYRRRT